MRSHPAPVLPPRAVRALVAGAAALVIVATAAAACTSSSGPSASSTSAQGASPSAGGSDTASGGVSTSDGASPTGAGSSTPRTSKTGKPGQTGSPTGAGRSSTGPGATGAPTGGTLSTVPPVVVITRSPKPLRSLARFGGGVTMKIVKTSAFSFKATGPGDVSGPAVAFTIKLTNKSSSSISLESVSVTADYGPGHVPASSDVAPRSKSFAGRLVAGGSAVGVYAFGIPEDQRRSVTLTLTYAAGRPVIVLKGSVP